MKKREIIIIVIAVLVGLYGILDYFVFSGSSAAGGDEKIATAQNRIDGFVQSSELNLAAAAETGSLADQAYMIAKAEAPWKRDPFGDGGLGESQEEQGLAEEKLPEMRYSGFIRAGKKILAVVNGMEYTVGELLVDVGYKVSSITSSKVVLLTEANKEIVLQLEEN